MARRYASAVLVLACFCASFLTGESSLHSLHRVPTGVQFEIAEDQLSALVSLLVGTKMDLFHIFEKNRK